MDNEIVLEENEFEYAEDFAPAQAYHASIQNEIDGINAPNSTKETIGKAAEGLKSHMERFQEAEKIYGPYPEVWEGFEPQSREITENIRNVGKQYQSNTTEEAKMEATKKAVSSINISSEYFVKQYEMLLAREELHLKEMQEIRQQLQDMQQLLNKSQTISVGAAFLQAADSLRKEAHKLKDRTVGKAYKNARQAVHVVHDSIVKAPAELREAVNHKVTETRNRAVTAVVNKVTGIFKKGISFLEKISNKVAAMAPQPENTDKDILDTSKETLNFVPPTRQEIMDSLVQKPNLPPDEQKNLVDFFVDVRNSLEENILHDFGKKTLTASEEGYILRDTVNKMIEAGLSDEKIMMVMSNMPINDNSLEMDSNNCGFSVSEYLKSDAVNRYRKELLSLPQHDSRPSYLPPTANEMIIKVTPEEVAKLKKDEADVKKKTPDFEVPNIAKLAKAPKITPQEMEYLIGYYQMRNNQLEASLIDNNSNHMLTSRDLGNLQKALVDIMLKDGMTDSRIGMITKKMTTRHPVSPEPLRQKDEFHLGSYLKSDEAKQIRQSALRNRENTIKKASAR